MKTMNITLHLSTEEGNRNALYVTIDNDIDDYKGTSNRSIITRDNIKTIGENYLKNYYSILLEKMDLDEFDENSLLTMTEEDK